MLRPITVVIAGIALVLAPITGMPAATGGGYIDPAMLWRFQTNDGTLTSPIVGGSVVYVASDGGYVYAIDSDAGVASWGTSVGDPVRVVPTVGESALYVNTGDFLALDIDSGGVRLRIHGDRNQLRSPVTLADGRVYVGGARNTNGFVDALSPNTGVLHWRQRMDGEIVAAPIVAAGVVYVGSIGGHFVAIDADTGEVIWQIEAVGPITNAAAVIDDVVYARSWDNPSDVTGDPATSRGFLYALDAATGTEHWRVTVDAASGSAPVVDNGMLFVSSGRAVFAFDVVSGVERWRFNSTKEVLSTPAVSDGILYVGARDANLYALDANTGVERWRFATATPIDSSPTVAGGVVYITSGDTLYAVATDCCPE